MPYLSDLSVVNYAGISAKVFMRMFSTVNKISCCECAQRSVEWTSPVSKFFGLRQ